MMKILLALAVALSVSVALSSAACSFKKLTLNVKTRSAVCTKDGEVHEIGDEWKGPSCEKCSCSNNGMQCCST
ncbi:Hypothetical predicted protein [Pelobates cultripes]|uniref:Uncharacterized protein n=1 Tax=Pelobates cultripes TaxID=61616 RepID=A0AAD1WNN5_PELCU|nr:Hypothetical predicted protein [Pelobates cultripes]